MHCKLIHNILLQNYPGLVNFTKCLARCLTHACTQSTPAHNDINVLILDSNGDNSNNNT